LLNLSSQKRSSTSLIYKEYRGRFAPSPSGLLHFGSLIAALASFLDARSQQGKWLVRIEDIDPPREQRGASQAILKTLEAFGLWWDEQVLYQSKQTQIYLDILQQLADKKLTYACQCTRAQIKASGGVYQNTCRMLNLPHKHNALRIINQQSINRFHDLIQGKVQCNKDIAGEDFTLVRKDGLFAYQLAVVVDDIYQNINHVIRGCDLLEPTARQLSFFSLLAQTPPQYGHFPIAISTQGYKLSKQNKAPAINNQQPQLALIAALKFLGQKPDTMLEYASVDELISWAIAHWSRDKIPKRREIMIPKK